MADFTVRIDISHDALIGAGAGRSSCAILTLDQSHKVGFIHEVQEVDIFGLAVAVNDDIKGVAALGLNSNELLFNLFGILSSGDLNLQEIVDQRKISGRRKGKRFVCILRTACVHALEHHVHNEHQHGRIDLAVLFSLFKQFQIVTVNIAGFLGYDDLVPVALGADYRYLFAVTKLIDDFIAHTSTGAKVQPTAVCDYTARSRIVILGLVTVHPFLSVDRDDDLAGFGNGVSVRDFLGGLRIRSRGFSILGGSVGRGIGDGTIVRIGKGRNRKARHAKHNEQQTKGSFQFILHAISPPFPRNDRSAREWDCPLPP